jgi:tetratricopeptide (TPR) repeat protein
MQGSANYPRRIQHAVSIKRLLPIVQRRGYFPVWRAALALISCETDRYDQAIEEIAELLHDFDALEAFPPHGWAVPTLALLADALDALHRAPAEVADQLDLELVTERLQRLLAPHLDEFTLAGWPVALVGPAARSAGVVALASGDPTGALDLFDRAARLAGSARPQRARLSFDQARAWLRLDGAGARSRAEGLLRRSLREAESPGMARLVAQRRHRHRKQLVALHSVGWSGAQVGLADGQGALVQGAGAV